MKAKVVTLEIVCREEDADSIIRQMEKCQIAQEGLYTLGMGERNLTDEEVEDVNNQLLGIIDEEIEK